MEKKDRERFSIKFNENDPAHQKVIDVLERQGSRKKAQFIVNAVLHYISNTEIPGIAITPSAVQPVDKAYIESVIREILEREGKNNSDIATHKSPQPVKKRESGVIYKESAAKENTELTDDATLSLISATLSAFRNT